MEVRIGVKGAPRELSIEATQSAEEIEKAIETALKAGSPTFTLTDDKGRRVVVPADKLAYVELGSPSVGQVGFRS